MEGLLVWCGRRVCSSAAWLNRNRNGNRNGVVWRSFSSQEPRIIDQYKVGVNGDLGSMMKEAEASENWDLFKSWMLEHNRNYQSQGETLYRYKIFCETKNSVDISNKENTGYTLGLNRFSDMTSEELRRDFTVPPSPQMLRMLRRRRRRHLRQH